LQEVLSAERASNSGARGEIKEWSSRLEQYKRTISQLESGKLALEQQIADLSAALEEQGATFRSQVLKYVKKADFIKTFSDEF